MGFAALFTKLKLLSVLLILLFSLSRVFFISFYLFIYFFFLGGGGGGGSFFFYSFMPGGTKGLFFFLSVLWDYYLKLLYQWSFSKCASNFVTC